MTVFCVKKISPPTRLGEQMCETRIKQGLSLAQLSTKTRISEKYLAIIENNHFDELPPTRAHRLAYIRAYAEALKLDYKKITRLFLQENGLKNITTKVAISKFQSFFNLSWGIRYLAAGVFTIFFVGYLGLQIRRIITPPVLSIYSPIEGSLSTNNETVIEGQTEKECHLTINGQDIQVDEGGKFSTSISLATGVNTINFSSTKKHGKTTEIIRHIIVKETPSVEILSINAPGPAEKI